MQRQLEASRLSGFFDAVFSADEIKRYKPAREPYAMATERLGVAPRDAWMVAAHAWDIAGAGHAGLRTAFVARSGKALNPAGIQPRLLDTDLGALASRMLAEA